MINSLATTGLLVLLTVILLFAGCENSDDIVSIIHDARVEVSDIEVLSVDPLDVSVTLDITDKPIEPPDPGTLHARLLGEWVDHTVEIGFAFYPDHTIGVLSRIDGRWFEGKFAGTYTLEKNNLTIVLGNGNTFTSIIHIQNDRLLMVDQADNNDQVWYTRLR